MTALFRAAAAVAASVVLAAGAVQGDRLLERRGLDLFAPSGGAGGADPAPDLARLAEGQGRLTARLEQVVTACGAGFALRRAGVAGVDHVLVFTSGDAAGRLERLSAPADLMRAAPARGALMLISPDGFEGVAFAPDAAGDVTALGAAAGRDRLALPCADADRAAAAFNGAGRAPVLGETSVRR